MIKLLKIKDGTYIVRKGSMGSYCSTVDDVIKTMHDLGVEFSEIEYGLVELIRNNHNLAEYGIRKTFMFSKKVA